MPSLPRPAPLAVLAAVAAPVFLAGCVGPDFTPPAVPKDAGYTPSPLPGATVAAPVAGGEAQHFKSGADIPAEWWRLFHSEPLNAMIAEALKANPTLEAAEAALRQAEESADAQRGGFFPQVQAGFSAERAKNANGTLSPVTTSPSPFYNLYTGQLSVSYTPDVWGANWRAVENLDAQTEAQVFQLEAAHLTLTANLVAAAINEAGLRGQIAAVTDIIRIERELLEVLKRQQDLGQVAEADVVAQKAALAQAEQALPPLEKQLAVQRDALAALMGHLPNQPPAQAFDLDGLTLPVDLPVSLPSKLVEQRPDIRQAEANLHAASAAVGVAIANRLPVVSLTADLGSTAALLAGNDPANMALFTPGTGFWSLAGSLTQPLFDGFTLLHRQHAAEAAFDQARAQYRSTVVTAFQNVADSLHALKLDAEALEKAAAAEKAADESLEITRTQLELGAVGYPSLLDAEQTELQARVALIQARAARFADTTALFQALGGGWWNRAPAGPPPAS